MATSSVMPLRIDLKRSEHYLEIAWNDDTICRYPLSHLREACPCVECRGGHDKMGPAHDPENILTLLPMRSYHVENIVPVGKYAVQIEWDDGHSTGIYTWNYLRSLCPPPDADMPDPPAED